MSIVDVYSMPFMQWSLIAGILSGAALGYLGIFILLRRVVFLGAALPQFAAFGVVGASLAGLLPVAGALAGVLGGVWLVSLSPSGARIAPDGLVGLLYAAASALAIIMLAGSMEGDTQMLRILSGDILGVSPDDVVRMGVAFGVIAVIHMAAWKEFLFVSYDPEMAATLGMKVRFWDALLYLTIGIAVALAIRGSGAIVSFAILVGPAATALMISRRFAVVVPLAAALGACSAAAGLTVSFYFDTPGGPTIAACAVAGVIPGSLIALARRG